MLSYILIFIILCLCADMPVVVACVLQYGATPLSYGIRSWKHTHQWTANLHMVCFAVKTKQIYSFATDMIYIVKACKQNLSRILLRTYFGDTVMKMINSDILENEKVRQYLGWGWGQFYQVVLVQGVCDGHLKSTLLVFPWTGVVLRRSACALPEVPWLMHSLHCVTDAVI